MTTILVTDATMQRCVVALAPPGTRPETLSGLGREPWLLNAEAITSQGTMALVPVEWRCRPPAVDVDEGGVPTNLAEACQWLKSMVCLAHQLNRPSTREHALTRRLLERIREFGVAIVQRLPEYQAADWG